MNFSAWAASLGLAEDLDPNESPNRDGRTFFEMYAFGADPKNLAQFPRPFLETNGGNFSLFQFRRPDTSDVRWRIESTKNLGQNWQSVAESEPGDSTWQTGPGISIEERENLIELRDSEAIESRSRFYRIKAEFEP